MDLIKVENDDSLSRDKKSRGIINTNMNEYEKHIALKRKREEKENSQKKELNTLREEVNQLKLIVENLLGKIDGNNHSKYD